MDIALHYEEKGEGEPLLLLHGNGEDGSYFKNQIDHFKDSYRVIAVDTRGHGQSPIEVGYRIAKRFARKSPAAEKNAEMLGLMVLEPHMAPEELSVITVPTLVICGSRDMIKTSHTKEIADHIPNARLSIIEGDHFIAGKQPAAFNKEVETFLREIR